MDAISYKQKEYLYSYFRSKPPELNLHLHKYYEFLYFISGDATYIVEDNLYKICLLYTSMAHFSGYRNYNLQCQYDFL